MVVETPAELNFGSVRESLMRIVPYCLDSDPSLMPLSCKPEIETETENTTTPTLRHGVGSQSNPYDAGENPSEYGAESTFEREPDPDDFSFWSELQAKRICSAIHQAFDVEYAPEVVLADANLSALANRILLSKQL